MKVLLDENLPHRLRSCLHTHDVYTVQYLNWNGIKNGELLSKAQVNGFQVLITADQGMAYQQNLKDRTISLICLSAQDWEVIEPYAIEILTAINAATPGSFAIVVCGELKRDQETHRP